MKIGFFTDIHLHKFSEFGGPDGNKRLDDGIRILDSILELFENERCEIIVFSGDFFHSRRLVDVDVLNKARSVLRQYANKFKHSFVIPGNHDWYDRGRSTSSIEFMSEHGFEVIDEFKNRLLGNKIGLYFIPWLPPVEQAKILDELESDKNGILFIHATPTGTKSPSGYTFKGLDLLKYRKKFKWMFCGDIHHRQYIENLVVAGAPMQHNFGDTGDERGVHILDTDTWKVDFHSLKGIYPEFIITSNISEINDKDYFRILGVDRGTVGEFSGKSNVSVLPVKRHHQRNRIDVSISSSPADAIIAYAKQRHGGLNRDKLINIGLEMLS